MKLTTWVTHLLKYTVITMKQRECSLLFLCFWKFPKVQLSSVTKPDKNKHLNLMELSLLPNCTLVSSEMAKMWEYRIFCRWHNPPLALGAALGALGWPFQLGHGQFMLLTDGS